MTWYFQNIRTPLKKEKFSEEKNFNLEFSIFLPQKKSSSSSSSSSNFFKLCENYSRSKWLEFFCYLIRKTSKRKTHAYKTKKRKFSPMNSSKFERWRLSRVPERAKKNLSYKFPLYKEIRTRFLEKNKTIGQK